MKIDIICRIIDNFGDIAVVWRLTKSFLQLQKECKIRLIVDKLTVFQRLVPEIVDAPWQSLQVKTSKNIAPVLVFRRDDLDKTPFFQQDIADVLIEAFGALPPENYYQAFHRASLERPRIILHLEYLTAEPWAQEYHLLPSPTPWPRIKRYFFVPGFLPRTGGLIIDEDFQTRTKLAGTYQSHERYTFRRQVFHRLGWHCVEESLLITIFSYEHNFSHFWKDLGQWLHSEKRKAHILAFEGRSLAGVRQAFEQYRRTPLGDNLVRSGQLHFQNVPFVAQTDYDDLILAGDLHLVRGEESWSRAVLAARLFLWHAYLQPQGHQRIKSQAYMTFLEPFFVDYPQLFQALRHEFDAFNHRLENSEKETPKERYKILLENIAIMEYIMKNVAKEIVENRHLTKNMLAFLQSF